MASSRSSGYDAGMTEYPVGRPSMVESAFIDLQHKEAELEELKKTKVVIIEMARGRLFFFLAVGASIAALNGFMSIYLSDDSRVVFFVLLSMLTGLLGIVYGIIQYRVAKNTYEEKLTIETVALADRINRWREIRDMFGGGRRTDWDTL